MSVTKTLRVKHFPQALESVKVKLDLLASLLADLYIFWYPKKKKTTKDIPFTERERLRTTGSLNTSVLTGSNLRDTATTITTSRRHRSGWWLFSSNFSTNEILFSSDL